MYFLHSGPTYQLITEWRWTQKLPPLSQRHGQPTTGVYKFACMYLLVLVQEMILKSWWLHVNSSSSLSLANSSSVPGNMWPVGKQRSTFWPQSRATSTSTLTLRGRWSCRQRHMLILKHQQSLRWMQRLGLHICCGTTVGRGSMPLVFLHSHLLDFNQPKTIHFFVFEIFYIEFAFGF